MPKIFDNIENHLTLGLNDVLSVSKRADFCVGYFNLRGWKEVVGNVDNLSGMEVKEGEKEIVRYCRLLVGMQKSPKEILIESFIQDEKDTIDNAEALKIKKRLAEEFKEQLTIGTPTNSDESALRKLSKQMKDGKVVVKLFLKYPLHAKLYLAYSQNRITPVLAFLGSSNLTFSGLVHQGELNIDVLEQDAANKLSNWFDERWNDRWCIDISKELIEVIDSSWATEKDVLPYHIYLKMAYHLAREARTGINEFKLPKVFQRELLDFQQKAVLLAAQLLNKRGGVIIGDVVGLGKTITATALAKLFEEDFFLETLIICPKNLVPMWEDYAHKYQLHAKVISQSMVQKTLPDLRRYRLVIIDESHNLRNSESSRYRAIKSYLEENNCKVILLSATPYNKSYVDLSNQIRLFIPDDMDLGISPERYIEKLGGVIQFAAKHTETHIRSIKAFEKSFYADDWKELMKLYLVRRTRSFIKNNYSYTDLKDGRRYLEFADGTKSYFPDRFAKKVEYKFEHDNNKDQYARLYSDETLDAIEHLSLPRYGLKTYIDSNVNPTIDEALVIQNLSRAGGRLIGFCKTNLFKRLESSGYSFLKSLCRHILRNFIYIYALERDLPLPIGKQVLNLFDDYLEDGDIENELYDDNVKTFITDEDEYFKQAERAYRQLVDEQKSRFQWIGSRLFKKDLLKALLNDSKEILKIIEGGREWSPKKDNQLNALYDLLMNKHSKEKVLIFSQFADTVNYLYEQLFSRGVNELDRVTGDCENPTEYAYRFSPDSNDKKEFAKERGEVRVLITTDVLSEGQNLQDSHIIVNYDLPWAIIRLIQRAGRVDRIGQKADEILCYSFLPEDGLEAIIRLRSRLTNRIKQNAEVVGSDEVFFEGDPINIEDLYSEKSGILDEQDDEDVDLASYAYQIWKNAIDVNSSLATTIPNMPNVVYSAKETALTEGAIVYAKTVEDNDVITWIDKDGKIITQSQMRILKAAECTVNVRSVEKLDSHHRLVKEAIEYIMGEETQIAGTLGKKSGVKYRTYMRLDKFCKDNASSSLITDSLKKAIDDIFKFPLKQSAIDTINRQMKSGIADKELIELVTSLREEDRLCIIDESEVHKRLPQIICSMGMVN